MLCRLVGLLVRSLFFFLLLFCFSFASLQGLEFKHSVVIVGRICPLVDVEAGFLILNLKNLFCVLHVCVTFDIQMMIVIYSRPLGEVHYRKRAIAAQRVQRRENAVFLAKARQMPHHSNLPAKGPLPRAFLSHARRKIFAVRQGQLTAKNNRSDGAGTDTEASPCAPKQTHGKHFFQKNYMQSCRPPMPTPSQTPLARWSHIGEAGRAPHQEGRIVGEDTRSRGGRGGGRR
jgi:hypothetical protein